jgi:hypothetical protein
MLLMPCGPIFAWTPYQWRAVPTATWYQVWAEDGSDRVFDRWFTAAEAACSSGEPVCSIALPWTPDVGAGRWFVRTWNQEGYGPWSPQQTFSTR